MIRRAGVRVRYRDPGVAIEVIGDSVAGDGDLHYRGVAELPDGTSLSGGGEADGNEGFDGEDVVVEPCVDAGCGFPAGCEVVECRPSGGTVLNTDAIDDPGVAVFFKCRSPRGNRTVGCGAGNDAAFAYFLEVVVPDDSSRSVSPGAHRRCDGERGGRDDGNGSGGIGVVVSADVTGEDDLS